MNYSPTQLNNLIDILSTPTHFAQEDLLAEKILAKLADKDLQVATDKFGNIYIQKGIPDSIYYPCVVAHMDTVHHLTEFNVHTSEDNKRLYALTPDGNKTGIGGDDKAGVFVCLELLERLDHLKVAFFVGEEYGCYGSRLADRAFFENVGYIIEFDAPEHNWISHRSNSVYLFDKDGIFFNKIKPILQETMGENLILSAHPYTDVCALKVKHDVSCINVSVGYFNMHEITEYVDIDICMNAIDMGEKMIKELGHTKYEYKHPTPLYDPFNGSEKGFLLEEKFMLYKKQKD